MIWTRRALPLTLLVIPLLPACPSDDGESGDTMSNDVTGNTSDAMTSTGDETASNDDSSVELGCAADAMGQGTDGATDPIMNTWGAPCMTDQDCIDIIGDPDAICDTTAVVYELPGGYCTKACSLPDMDTRSVPDAADCDPNGGVACIGVMGVFERCLVECTDDAQCNRDGYFCRALPMIGTDQDPKGCLMPDCCLDTCAEE